MSAVASIDDQRQSPPKDTNPDEAKPTGHPDITACLYQQDISKRRPANKTEVLQKCLSVLLCSLKCLHMRTCATGTRNLLQQSQFGWRNLTS
ncbi:hypothetical protein SprV_0200833200 [Sparganum proliferum]